MWEGFLWSIHIMVTKCVGQPWSDGQLITNLWLFSYMQSRIFFWGTCGFCDHHHFPSSLGVYWWLFDRYCIKSKVPKQLKGSIWDKYPLQIILIISGRDRVPLTSLVHPIVSADCNSSVYEVFNGLPRRFWGAWNSSFIPTRYLVAQFALEIIMRLWT